jgi:aminopeptidase N
VFRDQEFSATMRGADISRIKDVISLRARQFPEDAGPLAHPVRPKEYLKIDNFYTATIYEKGAELVRMLKTLIGDENFKKGMDHYFETLDGTAATIEQFLSAFETAAGVDLSDFQNWYGQAGTPHLHVEENWDADNGELTLTLRQHTPPTPGQPDKKALPMPIRTGLVGKEGPLPMTLDGDNEAGPDERILVLDKDEQSWCFTGLTERPLVSVLRGFSAPVVLKQVRTPKERASLMTTDADLLRRWEEAQAYGMDVLLALAENPHAEIPAAYLDALGALTADAKIDPAFAALAILPPSESDAFQHMNPADPGRIHEAREAILSAFAHDQKAALMNAIERTSTQEPFSPDAKGAGQRALHGTALGILARLGPKEGGALALAAHTAADNMTDSLAALIALGQSGSEKVNQALEAFYQNWKANPLVIDKWFSIQVGPSCPDALERVEGLLKHPDFTYDNPNRVRSLIGAFIMINPAAFHAADGSGYALLARQIKIIDPKNPALAARLLGVFESWRQLEPTRSHLAKTALEGLLKTPDLSPNSYEIISRQLG